MADQAVVKSPAPYVSENPEADLIRFKNTLRQVVSVPKQAVDKAIAEEAKRKVGVKKSDHATPEAECNLKLR